MEKTYDHVLKLLLLGDVNVGKSSLLVRFTEDVFRSIFKATIGVDFHIRIIVIDGKIIRLEIWDIAGVKRFRSMRLYFRSVNGFMLVYDVTSRSSLNCARDWIRDLEEHMPDVEKIILGNKCDLNDSRKVSREEGEELALNYGIKFWETSAKSSINVEEAFFTLVRDIMSRLSKKTSDCNPSAEGPVDISESQSKSLFCCCCPWH